MSGRLVVCPTPIGNLEDVTLRVLSALREADVVACEDTRRTRVLLDRYGVQAPLVSYHEHNERARAAELVERMRGGRGGGARVRRRHAAGVGPGLRAGARRAWRPGCGGGAAGAVGGDHRAGGVRAARRPVALPGFLPRKQGELREVLAEPGGTLVAFESPRRLPATLALLAELDPEREVAVCRELTKAHEEVVRGHGRRAGGALRRRRRREGEMVLVIGPPPRARRRRAGPGGARRARAARRRGRQAAEGRHRGRRADGRQAQTRCTGRSPPSNALATAEFLRLARALARSLARSYGRPMRRSLPPPLPSSCRPLPQPARRRVGLARGRRGHHPLPQRRRPIRDGPAPRHRHRGARRHAGGRGGRRRRPFAGTAGLLRADDLDPTGDGYAPRTCTSRARRARGAHGRGGDRIGAVGTSGVRSATAPHLHFGVRDAGTRHDYRDPLAFLPPPPPPARAPDPPPPAPAPAPRAGTARTGARHRPAPAPSPTRGATPPPPGAARAGCRTPRPHAGRTPCRTACPTPFRPRAARRSARRPPSSPAAPRARPVGSRAPYARGPAFGRTPVAATPERGERALGASRPAGARRPDSLRQSDDQRVPAAASTCGWAAACAGSFSPLGSLGMTGWHPPPVRRAAGSARFSLANCKRKTPRPRPAAAPVASTGRAVLRHHAHLLRERRAAPRATRTRRSPPTCSRATCASAARTSSSSRAPTSTASRSPRRPSARASRRASWATGTPCASRSSRPRLNATNDFFIRTTDPEHVAKVAEVVQRDPRQRPRLRGHLRGLVLPALRRLQDRGRARGRQPLPDPQDRARAARRRTTGSSGCRPSRSRSSGCTRSGPDSSARRTATTRRSSFIKGGLQDVSLSRVAAQVGRAGAVGRVAGDLRLDRRAPQLLHGALLRPPGRGPHRRASGRPTVHLIGKDILKFHAVIWPAMLMAAGIEVPAAGLHPRLPAARASTRCRSRSAT